MRLPLAALCLALSFAPAAAQTVEDGFEAYDAGDYATAKTILLPLAEAGDARAMNRIGYMYDFGKGFPEDPTAACDWYEKAAELGYAQAQSNLGLCFRDGTGRNKDLDTALRWEVEAATNGHRESQMSLVVFYKTRNLGEAQRWARALYATNTTAGRVSAWYARLSPEGESATVFDKWCFTILTVALKRPLNACDHVFSHLPSPFP
ncbi:exported hypothetical protein [uncultured Alphaproteobacteria bacterium]|uniref:Sel1 repeat family protein n=1 Tax=uncultured Alphaproteobacteria bacterium TaxID=91750 RepID=A0A212KMB2_9PROT|nr:exported hypothetical protein [uncultured Alphaproteobacteria bacterium]